MGFYRVTAVSGRTFIRQATRLDTATAAAHRDHPEGVQAVAVLSVQELAELMEKGFTLPVRAREVARRYLKGLKGLRKALKRSADDPARPLDAETMRKDAERMAVLMERQRKARAAKAKATKKAKAEAAAREQEQRQRPEPVRVTTEMLLKGIEL